MRRLGNGIYENNNKMLLLLLMKMEANGEGVKGANEKKIIMKTGWMRTMAKVERRKSDGDYSMGKLWFMKYFNSLILFIIFYDNIAAWEIGFGPCHRRRRRTVMDINSVFHWTIGVSHTMNFKQKHFRKIFASWIACPSKPMSSRSRARIDVNLSLAFAASVRDQIWWKMYEFHRNSESFIRFKSNKKWGSSPRAPVHRLFCLHPVESPYRFTVPLTHNRIKIKFRRNVTVRSHHEQSYQSQRIRSTNCRVRTNSNMKFDVFFSGSVRIEKQITRRKCCSRIMKKKKNAKWKVESGMASTHTHRLVKPYAATW